MTDKTKEQTLSAQTAILLLIEQLVKLKNIADGFAEYLEAKQFVEREYIPQYVRDCYHESLLAYEKQVQRDICRQAGICKAFYGPCMDLFQFLNENLRYNIIAGRDTLNIYQDDFSLIKDEGWYQIVKFCKLQIKRLEFVQNLIQSDMPEEER